MSQNIKDSQILKYNEKLLLNHKIVDQGYQKQNFIQISQFLNLNHEINQHSQDFELDSIFPSSNVFGTLNMSSAIKQTKIEQNFQGKEISNHKKYQNFQRHLIITIIQLLNLSGFVKTYSFERLEIKILSFLNKNKKKSKRLLYSLFQSTGNNNQLQGNNIIEVSINQDLYNKYSAEEIKLAQFNIRNHLLRTMESIELNNYVNKRRMKNKKGFVEYLNRVFEQIKTGSISLRMKKKYTRKYQQN